MMKETFKDRRSDLSGNIPHSLSRPTASEVYACQFSSWYSTFRGIDSGDQAKYDIDDNQTVDDVRERRRKNVTIESIVIRPLPPDFIEYLLSDGVCLPDGATKLSSCINGNDSKDDQSDSSDDHCNDVKKISFPSLTMEIENAITTLGGVEKKGCMPKLNWSSPKDASWINCGSLKCNTVGDVYLLLKSSEFVVFDLENAWKDLDDDYEGEIMEQNENSENSISLAAIDLIAKSSEKKKNYEIKDLFINSVNKSFEYELVLKKWCNLHPSMEFRCFVYDHELIAISQRHHSKFYAHLQCSSNQNANPLVDRLQIFFRTYIRKRFAEGQIHKYVIDLYVDNQERTWIIDFNVWGTRTDGLLFEWEELIAIATSASNCNRFQDNTFIPEMRVVTKEMKSMTYDPLSSFRGPTDVLTLLYSDNNCSNDWSFDGSPSFEHFMKQCVRPSEM